MRIYDKVTHFANVTSKVVSLWIKWFNTLVGVWKFLVPSLNPFRAFWQICFVVCTIHIADYGFAYNLNKSTDHEESLAKAKFREWWYWPFHTFLSLEFESFQCFCHYHNGCFDIHNRIICRHCCEKSRRTINCNNGYNLRWLQKL